MLTVCLSNNTIRVAAGKAGKKIINVKELYSTSEAEGKVINGTVVDRSAFAEMITEFWNKYNLPKKDIVLIIDSTQFITKQIEAPIMKKKNIPLFVKNEFSTIERMSDPIFSYTSLYEDKTKSTQYLFSAAAERNFIDTQIELFASLGIQISSIKTALGSALHLLSKINQIKNKNCLVQLFDDMDVTNILFINGNYTYSSKTRLFEEKGTLAFAAEVSRTVSNIMQFVKAKQIDSDITDVFMCGVDEKTFEICSNAIEIVSTSLTTNMLDVGAMVSTPKEFADIKNDYLYAIGGLYSVEKEADLLGQYKIAHKAKPQLKEAIKLARPVIICFILFLLILIGLFVYRTIIRGKINDIYDFTRSASVLKMCEEYDALDYEITLKQEYITSLKSLNENNLSYPLPNTKLKKVLDTCAYGLVDISIKSYDCESGILSVHSTASDVELINQFVKLLRLQDSFHYVTYTGYTYSDPEQKWVVNVVCYLSETAGKEVQSND